MKFQGKSAFRTSAKKAPKSENPRLQFTKKKQGNERENLPKEDQSKVQKSENKRENHPKKRNSRESLHPRTSAKKAPKSENPRLQFTKKNREMSGKIYPKGDQSKGPKKRK